MRKIFLTLALGLITLGLSAQIRVYVGNTHRGSSIINQVYHSNYSTYGHNIIPCCQNLNYCVHNNRGQNRYNNYIWVEGHRKYSKRYHDYVWVEGRWIRKRQGRTWIAGSYTLNNGIKVWISGFWR